jgi:predicted transcriptional regulator
MPAWRYHGDTMADTTTLKLPPRLKTRIARLARLTGRAPHAVMLEALEREISREERMREFVREAMATDAAIAAGAEVYPGEDVHAWLERLARGGKPRRPASSRR